MTNITEEEFLEIFENEDTEWEGDNALQGLNIIAKYMGNKTVLNGATHDMIHSVSIDDLIDNGITREDTNKLRMLSWMIEEQDYLSCFV